MEMPYDAMDELSDESLLVRYAGGDAVAARVLMARLAPWVLAQATRRLGIRAEAEDVTQEAMLRLWKVAPRWEPGSARVSTWLYRVVANLCTDRQRRTRGVALSAVAEPVDPAAGVEERMQDDARAEALRAALARLPARQREAVELRHIDGLANPEIAEIMDTGIEAVESLIARGKRALAADLTQRKDELGYTDGGQ
ncbi:RNA polymerase sigma factor [Roseovarius sp. TE539]|uniref:RNA polymerase sigma factor n=1 Tax=Roseovarius sp. TE539 TaxID=2249812 RepID=UPI000DDE6286|nr:RNA polymerase sigma factor [Roseovarius sp. TE539]RBI74492.1 RNA polymerase sigma factor [Roseovarius sp. TE539]